MNEEKRTLSKEIYEALSKPIKDQFAIQRTNRDDTKKGYDTTGYGYQFLVNRFNEVLGIGGWNWSFEEIKTIEGAFQSGQKYYDVTGEVTISIFYQTGTPQDIIVAHKETGGHRSSSYADARKGASTNGFKKTAAFFGVGKSAYEGTIDEDNVLQDETKATKESKKTATGKPEKIQTKTAYEVAVGTLTNKVTKWTKIELEEKKERISVSSLYKPEEKQKLIDLIDGKLSIIKS